MKIKFDKNLALTLAGGVLCLAGTIAKGIGEKNKDDEKLNELINKAVSEKLQDK